MAVAYQSEGRPIITKETTWREFVDLITPYVPELKGNNRIPENSLLANFLKSTMNGFYLSSMGIAHELGFNSKAINFTGQYLLTRH